MRYIYLTLFFAITIIFVSGCSNTKNDSLNLKSNNKMLSFSGLFQNTQLKTGDENYTGTWNIIGEKINSGYLYEITIDNTLNFSFISSKIIQKNNIKENNSNLIINNKDIPLFVGFSNRFNPLLGKNYSFKIKLDKKFEINCSDKGNLESNLFFPTGTGKVFSKGLYSPDMTYPYINHLTHGISGYLLESIFPSIWDKDQTINPNHFGENDCLIEIGNIYQIQDIPFVFGSGSENIIIAITKEKTESSQCKKLMEHKINSVFYNNNLVCSLWIDEPIIQSISLLK